MFFVVGLVTLTLANAKDIKIQIDPDDILKIINGMMSAETVKKFATQLAQRELEHGTGYKNPYHPEDDLVNTFNDAVDKEKSILGNKLRQQSSTTTEKEIDPLDLENDKFIDENEVLSEDLLTENEHGKLSGLHPPPKDNKNQEKPVDVQPPIPPSLSAPSKNDKAIKTIRLSRPTRPNPILAGKPTHYKKPTKIIHSSASIHISAPVHQVGQINRDKHAFPYKRPFKIGGPGKVFKPAMKRATTSNPDSKPEVISTGPVQTRKDSGHIYEDDRANFKPVQTRFVLKSSSDGEDNTTRVR